MVYAPNLRIEPALRAEKAKEVGHEVVSYLGNFFIRYINTKSLIEGAGFIDKEDKVIYLCEKITKEQLESLVDFDLREYSVTYCTPNEERWEKQKNSWKQELAKMEQEKSSLLNLHLDKALLLEANVQELELTPLYMDVMSYVEDFAKSANGWNEDDLLVKSALYGSEVGPPAYWNVSESDFVKALVYKLTLKEVNKLFLDFTVE